MVSHKQYNPHQYASFHFDAIFNGIITNILFHLNIISQVMDLT
jgi:hypothetical protein